MKKLKINKMSIFIVLTIFIVSLFTYLIIKDNNKQDNKNTNLEDVQTNSELIYDEVKLEDSGITGDDIEVDTNYNIYYTYLNEDEQKLYKQIYANTINVKKAFIPVIDTNYETVLKIYQFVTYDYPELFWIDNGFSYKHNLDGKVRQITLKYNKLAENIEDNKNTFNSVANSIIESASNLKSDYEKEKYVYNALVKKIKYDKNSEYNQTIYSALVNNLTVCAGYSKAYQYIMNKLGIVTYYVTGTANNEAHAWNIVKLDNGYYNVDLTWKEFNISDKQYAATHVRSEYSSQLPTCASTTYIQVKQTNNTNNTTSNTTKNSSSTSNSATTNNSVNQTNNTTNSLNTISTTNTTNTSTDIQSDVDTTTTVEDTTQQNNQDVDSNYEYGKTTDVTDSSDTSNNNHRNRWWPW